jgi:hypothetical protein
MAFARLFYRVSFVLLALASVAGAQTITGRWDGTAKIADNFTVPVHLEISGAGSHVQGALILINGAQRLPATVGDISGDSLTLKFAQYAVTLQATLQDGALRGTYTKHDGTFAYPVELRPHQPGAPASGRAPDIAGVWIISTGSPESQRKSMGRFPR